MNFASLPLKDGCRDLLWTAVSSVRVDEEDQLHRRVQGDSDHRACGEVIGSLLHEQGGALGWARVVSCSFVLSL